MSNKQTLFLLVGLDLEQLETLRQVREAMQVETLEAAATRILAEALQYEIEEIE